VFGLASALRQHVICDRLAAPVLPPSPHSDSLRWPTSTSTGLRPESGGLPVEPRARHKVAEARRAEGVRLAFVDLARALDVSTTTHILGAPHTLWCPAPCTRPSASPRPPFCLGVGSALVLLHALRPRPTAGPSLSPRRRPCAAGVWQKGHPPESQLPTQRVAGSSVNVAPPAITAASGRDRAL
jgi:hypothetical protein